MKELERGPNKIVPFFFCSRPNYFDELARKRLLRRLGTSKGCRTEDHIYVSALAVKQKFRQQYVAKFLKGYMFINAFFPECCGGEKRAFF